MKTLDVSITNFLFCLFVFYIKWLSIIISLFKPHQKSMSVLRIPVLVTNYPPNLTVTAFIPAKLWRGADSPRPQKRETKPGLDRFKVPSSLNVLCLFD